MKARAHAHSHAQERERTRAYLCLSFLLLFFVCFVSQCLRELSLIFELSVADGGKAFD